MQQNAKKLQAEDSAAEFFLTPERIDLFLDFLKEKGRIEETLKYYRRALEKLYEYLPAGKGIQKNTLAQWRENLFQEGYSIQTVNSSMTAANGLLNFFGRRDLQRPEHVRQENSPQPELSRAEYLQMLRTAKWLGRERVYLWIKLFACIDLPLQELPRVTVEAVSAGRVALESDGTPQVLRIPAQLQAELLDFARRIGVASGPVFIRKSGEPVSRTNVSSSIHNLCEAAGVPSEKGNPRCLRRLYQSTREGIRESINLEAVVDQLYDRLIETEQQAVGWR